MHVQLSGDDGNGGVIYGEICTRLVLVFLLVLGKDLMCTGGTCLVEEARSLWNKLLLVVFHLAVMRSGACRRPVRLRFAGSVGSRVR
jgi:hypothetical protein